MAVMVSRAVDELAELEQWLGTHKAVADVLRKSRPQITRWLGTQPDIQGRNRRLINDCWSVVRLLRSSGEVEPMTLTHTLLGRRPELGYRRPADLIQSGETDELIATLSVVAESEGVDAMHMDTVTSAAELDQVAAERPEPFAIEGFAPYDVEGAARAGLVGQVSDEQPLPSAPATVHGLALEATNW